MCALARLPFRVPARSFPCEVLTVVAFASNPLSDLCVGHPPRRRLDAPLRPTPTQCVYLAGGDGV
jgi:hypothetical protein